jgi:hypothetical protein
MLCAAHSPICTGGGPQLVSAWFGDGAVSCASGGGEDRARRECAVLVEGPELPQATGAIEWSAADAIIGRSSCTVSVPPIPARRPENLLLGPRNRVCHCIVSAASARSCSARDVIASCWRLASSLGPASWTSPQPRCSRPAASGTCSGGYRASRISGEGINHRLGIPGRRSCGGALSDPRCGFVRPGDRPGRRASRPAIKECQHEVARVGYHFADGRRAARMGSSSPDALSEPTTLKLTSSQVLDSGIL